MTQEYIDEPCRLCEAHRTERGTLESIKKVVEEIFSGWGQDEQGEFIRCWFREYKLDQRTLMIQQSKERTTERIQEFKKRNIKAFNK